MAKPAGYTRSAILAAAATEFAAHGFDGASVDDIARRSGLNKAMIYYHFKSKNGLYLEILRDMFRAVGARTRAIAAAGDPPQHKIGAFIGAFNAEAVARPHFPFIMMREIADGARRLDAGTLRLMAALFRNLSAILAQGVEAGVFRETNPVLSYFSLISPVIFFRAATPVREAMLKHHLVPGADFDSDTFVAQLKASALTVLNAGARRRLDVVAPAAAPTRRRPSRSGDHA